MCRRLVIGITAAFPSAGKGVCQSRRIGERACGAFTQSGSKRSEAPGGLRLCHGGATKAGVQHVWHPNLQQFPRVSRLEETRLLLPMDGRPAPCSGHSETEDARTSLG